MTRLSILTAHVFSYYLYKLHFVSQNNAVEIIPNVETFSKSIYLGTYRAAPLCSHKFCIRNTKTDNNHFVSIYIYTMKLYALAYIRGKTGGFSNFTPKLNYVFNFCHVYLYLPQCRLQILDEKITKPHTYISIEGTL